VNVSFVYPSTHHRTGGVISMYHFANGLAARGHEVHFIHGPRWKDRIESLETLAWFPFHDRVRHHIVDSLDDPRLPRADVCFSLFGPSALGMPAAFVQGFRMMPLDLERAIYRLPGPKVCVARWLVDVGLGFGVPPAQLWHVPMGIDHDLFCVRTPLDERPLDVALLFNPHLHKGWDVGLGTLELLRERRPQLQAAVFGATKPVALPDWVHWWQAPTHPVLAEEVYNRTRVFLQTSYTEGFGFTAVEAMACGAALVTTDNGGHRDYAVDDETALVAPIGDAPAVAQATEALLDDEVRRFRLASAGARLVRRFQWETGAAILEGHLERYVASPIAFRGPAADFERTDVPDGASEEAWRRYFPE
jgi:glycosyltransferase involved in cell wall biosynthesis